VTAVTQTSRIGARQRPELLNDCVGRGVSTPVTQTVDCGTLALDEVSEVLVRQFRSDAIAEGHDPDEIDAYLRWNERVKAG
jgi:hypothetical protein